MLNYFLLLERHDVKVINRVIPPYNLSSLPPHDVRMMSVFTLTHMHTQRSSFLSLHSLLIQRETDACVPITGPAYCPVQGLAIVGSAAPPTG